MPEYYFTSGDDVEWRRSTVGPGIEIKDLGGADGFVMELIRFEPNTGFPDHEHLDAEFVYMIEGAGRQDGTWMSKGWSSAATAGTLDLDFISGPDGCVMLTVYGRSRTLTPGVTR